MQRCDWCQEIGHLVPVVNHDPTSSHECDLVCPTCAELELSEHIDELFMEYSSELLTIGRTQMSMAVRLDDLCA
jgi:hypothetical protein